MSQDINLAFGFDEVVSGGRFIIAGKGELVVPPPLELRLVLGFSCARATPAA
jgi:hypothetical protein